eukprot:TRINITY_DN3788_c0_g1_i1.p1 TRINITY_DN3788_c0_g1~~TRINITY_DN3788_c0_g1_i1.p1  ORF type:complete len:889 (-),score=193.18 TRINITY_DN3788_c0_g1_i1:772-3438(-)
MLRVLNAALRRQRLNFLRVHTWERARSTLLIDGEIFAPKASQADDADGNSKKFVQNTSRTLQRLLKQFEPNLVGAVLDPARKETAAIAQTMRAFGVTNVEHRETRGILAGYAESASQQGDTVTIATGRREMSQLVTANVSLTDKLLKMVTLADVVDKFGVSPKLVPDSMALTGLGVGPKTITTLLSQYGSLESVLENIDSVEPKRARDALAKSVETARTQYADLKVTACESSVPLARLTRISRSPAAMLEFFKSHNCEEIVSQLQKEQEQRVFQASLLRGKYVPISTKSDLQRVVDVASKAKKVAISVQQSFTNDDDLNPTIAGISLCTTSAEAVYLPFGHTNDSTQLKSEDAIALLKPLLQDASVTKIAFDMKQQIKALAPLGLSVNGLHDVMLMSYVLDCGKFSHHKFPDVVKEYLGAELTSDKDVLGTGMKRIPAADASVAALAPVDAQRADATMRLFDQLEPRLEKEGMKELYDTIDMPLSPVLASMEMNGIKIDEKELYRIGHEFEERLTSLDAEIYAEAGCEFKINSPKELGSLLFETLQLKTKGVKLKKGLNDHWSVSSDVLEDLADQGHKLPKLVLQHRAVAKLHSTYVIGLGSSVNPRTGRVHTCFMNAVTSTGRLSSVNPNLQNIPIRSSDGKLIRRAFIAKDKHLLLKADYSQVELRILAHMAGVQQLIDAFLNNVDVHTQTASQVFGIPYDKIDKPTRQKAKAINFGIVYGISEFGLSRQLDISNAQARQYIAAYFKQYPGILDYMNDTKAFCRVHGYVSTLFGRRCWIPDIKSSQTGKRQFSERAAINTPIQGTSADITKIVMNRIPDILKKHNFSTRMLLQVHDELVFEAPEEEAAAVAPVIKAAMESVSTEYSFRVPLIVDVTTSNRWLADDE